jgi:hypothetical protein
MKDTGAALTVVTAGPLLANVLEACKDLSVNLVYFHTIKPIDTEVLARFRQTQILVVHDGFGLREAINEMPGMRTWYHGLPDQFCVWYTVRDIRRRIGLDPAGYVGDRIVCRWRLINERDKPLRGASCRRSCQSQVRLFSLLFKLHNNKRDRINR